METTIRFRPAQTLRFERVAAAFRNLDDEALVQVTGALRRLVIDSLEDGHEWEDPTPQAFAAVSDIAADEENYRLGVVWNAEAEMRGGHFVNVSDDWSERGTFQALCFPEWDDGGGGRTCWEGPVRATYEEALEDGKRHNPGFEPEDHRTTEP